LPHKDFSIPARPFDSIFDSTDEVAYIEATEKQLEKHRQTAARPLEQWADEWLAKKKVEKVKRGRIVAVRDPKTIKVLELRVGYIKDRFGKLYRLDIKRPCFHAFIRSRGKAGNPQPRAQHR
jgi:hypothetical protein